MTTARGYFGVAVYHPKTEVNIGTLWRTSRILGAAFLATIGHRYRRQASDTTRADLTTPLWHFDTIEEMRKVAPESLPFVGVELTDDAIPLSDLWHPPRCIYLLGAEDHGIPQSVLDRCQTVTRLPGDRSMNVAVAGSIVLYDRVTSDRLGWSSLRKRIGVGA